MMKKLLKITEIATVPKTAQFPSYQRYRFQILIAQIEDWNKDCIKVSRLCLLQFPINKPSKRVTVRSGPPVNRLNKFIHTWSDFFKRFYSYLERPILWLIIGTSFTSLTRKYSLFVNKNWNIAELPRSDFTEQNNYMHVNNFWTNKLCSDF